VAPNYLLRLRVPLGFIFGIWYLVAARPSSLFVLGVCTVFVMLGCALRAWAAGYLLKGKRVAVGGPYAFIRNPLYAGSFLIGVGFCAALWRWPPAMPVLILWSAYLLGFGVVYPAKMLAEEKELAANLGVAYTQYALKVPAFLPIHGRVPELGDQRFSAELYRRNREYQCLLGSASLLLVLTLRMHYGF
jgi:protein-S-isoprenylcysteine O-methyltransferase Ste14